VAEFVTEGAHLTSQVFQLSHQFMKHALMWHFCCVGSLLVSVKLTFCGMSPLFHMLGDVVQPGSAKMFSGLMHVFDPTMNVFGIAVFMMVAVVMVAVVGEFVQSVFSVLCLFANFA